jgi:hypothetical protein
MTGALPAPDEVPDHAREAAGADTGPNLVVAGAPDPAAVERTDDGYDGDGAGDLGRLAAAARVAARTDARLHYPDPDAPVDDPDPDVPANGPWLVLEPLSGFVSTVARGTGTVTVRANGDDPDATRSDLLAAARPSHDHYPVAEDDRGVFTTGLSTFELADATVSDGELTATFDVLTTPATTSGEVERRFASVDAVREATFTPAVGVERTEPSPALREAVEGAHLDVLGDAQYEWLPAPTVFSRIPGDGAVALGTGDRGAALFSGTAYAHCVELLSACVAELDGGER